MAAKMGRTWWLLLSAFAVGVTYAAPKELTTDELITKPRPGEEFVHIQTSSQNKHDLVDKSFTTSHRIPELSKTNRSQDFQTSHKIPLQLERAGRSVTGQEEPEEHGGVESSRRVVFSVAEGTTSEPPLERVVTRTSIKMSKSKKVQKSVVKVAHDDLVDIKSDEGFIDERPKADEEEKEIMKKKFSKSERVESSSEEFSPPTRFNVPFEDEDKEVNLDPAYLIIPNPVIATTQEPPITTFNYKNVYDKTRKTKGFVGDKPEDKYRYETVSSESIKTAESKSITSKKDTKQEKKDRYGGKEKEESGFYVLPVNKQARFKEDNYDFVDVEEKVLVPAGSSPSQSSRINIKKGPNGQEYEYEYVYYYYDDDEEGGNGGSGAKEGKPGASTTEKVYNGHDGPAREDQEQNSVQSTSTSGGKYLPTEATRPASKGKAKTQIEVTEEVDDIPPQNFVSKGSRGGSISGGSRFSQSNRQSEFSRQQETANEVYPSSGRSQARARGRGSSSAAVQEEDIPSIGEERLPANTRFPPRSRANNAPATSPQPQETTARTRGREGGSNQSRLRIPNLGLLDSSSFRTHASDASIEDDASLRDAELQRKANARGQGTESAHRRGTRPTTLAPAELQDVPAVTRRPAIRKPVEERRPRPSVDEEEEVVEEKRFKAAPEEGERVLKVPQEETQSRPRVPLEEEVTPSRIPKVPLEEEQEVVKRPLVPLEDEEEEEEVRQKEIAGEGPHSEEVRPQPQTTRESDAEEGVFENAQVGSTSGQSATDQNGEVRTSGSTTEDPSVPGLTSAMMEKVALDLYAILQQAQNENIRTNFIDGNSTDVTTDLGEGQTEFSIEGDGPTAEPSTTTTTTTTTTTPAPTTTTTTTTPAPTQAPGRGRYRGRVAGGNGKGRAKASTTTTTEPPEEVSSPKTRGRFQPGHGTRGSGLSFSRKPVKPAAREPAPEEAPASEETPRAAPERGFGERPRSRFRTSGKVTTSAPSTAAPTAPATGAAAVGARGGSAERLNSRRRGGGRTSLTAGHHAAVEGQVEEERQETHQETAGGDETTPSAPLRPTRPRIGGAVRPLRPGPRAPLLLPQRGHQAALASTSPLPAEREEIEKEVVETEIQAQQPNEEVHEGQTTPGDALTRLKSRPRLRIGANANHQRPQTPPPPPPQNRRKLVSSLLPKRKPTEEKPAEKVEDAEERTVPEEIPAEEELPSAPVEPSSTTAEPEAKGLSGLLAGRRRNLNRRPGTIYSRAQPAEA